MRYVKQQKRYILGYFDSEYISVNIAISFHIEFVRMYAILMCPMQENLIMIQSTKFGNAIKKSGLSKGNQIYPKENNFCYCGL